MTITQRPDLDALQQTNADLEASSASEILRWGFETFHDGIALATGFGPSGVVLMDLVSRIRPETTIFYLDTGFLFEETHRLRRTLAERLGLTFQRVSTSLSPAQQEVAHGPALWEREPDRCCAIRKVSPLREFMRTREAWITGIRRDQSKTRREIDIVSWDAANEAYKLCPLATWTSDDVWSYLRLHDLPGAGTGDQVDGGPGRGAAWRPRSPARWPRGTPPPERRAARPPRLPVEP